jgi:hypothetical protein
VTRIATCACEQLRVTCEGDPDRISICSCTQCQRRTGSVYGVGAYFSRDKITGIEGEATVYRRMSEMGRWLDIRFCPRCGTSVYWEAEFIPDMMGVAVGTFADPSFPSHILSLGPITWLNGCLFPRISRGTRPSRSAVRHRNSSLIHASENDQLLRIQSTHQFLRTISAY